jgi:hypothetical protein
MEYIWELNDGTFWHCDRWPRSLCLGGSPAKIFRTFCPCPSCLFWLVVIFLMFSIRNSQPRDSRFQNIPEILVHSPTLLYLFTYLLAYLLHGAESFLTS